MYDEFADIQYLITSTLDIRTWPWTTKRNLVAINDRRDEPTDTWSSHLETCPSKWYGKGEININWKEISTVDECRNPARDPLEGPCLSNTVLLYSYLPLIHERLTLKNFIQTSQHLPKRYWRNLKYFCIHWKTNASPQKSRWGPDWPHRWFLTRISPLGMPHYDLIQEQNFRRFCGTFLVRKVKY